MRDIRKISVGEGYPDSSIHYQVGKSFKLQDATYVVSKITENLEYKKFGKIAYDIYLSNENGTVLWKTISGVAVIIEDNIDFD